MLTTGIDTKMVKLIVLEANIGSMTEFKQIIGRGTRIREAEGKLYFNIMDFRKATNLFADPEFDGDPVLIYNPNEGDPITPPETDKDEPDSSGSNEGEIDISDDPEVVKKFFVNSVAVRVIQERVQYYGRDGKLITESLKDYTRNNINKEFASLNEFTTRWNASERKEELIAELAEHGILIEALREEVGQDIDAFDLICHVAFDQPALTRKERANNVRKRNYFGKYSAKAQEVLNTLLDKYEQEGITTIEQGSVLKVTPFREMGSVMELVQAFGKKKDFDNAIQELENELYKVG
jgi:type I restriction enzyme R subunit